MELPPPEIELDGGRTPIWKPPADGVARKPTARPPPTPPTPEEEEGDPVRSR